VTLAQRLRRFVQRLAMRLRRRPLHGGVMAPIEARANALLVRILECIVHPGSVTYYDGPMRAMLVEEFEAIRSDEREACAQLADDQYATSQNPNCAAIAAAIRART
jgi:hypothetical protein